MFDPMFRIAISAIAAAGLAAATCRAADPIAEKVAIKKAVEVLLDKGWAKTADARALPTHATLDKPPLDAAPDVLQARWLALMFQGRYELALDKVKLVLAKEPSSIDALHAEAWMRMVGQDYGQALAAARRLGDALPLQQAGQPAPADAAATEDALLFLGHMSGFLEGPANKANDSERQKLDAQLEARLSDNQKEIYKSARQDAVGQFGRMQQQAGQFKSKSKEEADAAKQEKQQKLDTKEQQLAEAKAKADAEAKRAEDELKRKMADLQRQDAPLQQQWMTMKNQLNLLNNQIQRKEDQLRDAERQAADPKNPAQQTANNQANNLRNDIRDLNSRVNFTNNEIFRVEAAHQRLVQQGLVSQWQAQNQGQQLQGERGNLERELKKTDREQRRVAEGKDKADAEAQALARRAATLAREAVFFTTYDQFPFESVKDRLLKRVK